MMQTKVCTKCGVEKGLGEFCKHKEGRFGVNSRCRDCVKQYRKENRERISEYRKRYHQENRERELESSKQYHQENRERVSEYRKQYYQENRDKLLEHRKQYYQENRERELEYSKQYSKRYYQENRERRLEYRKQYYQENRERISERSRQYRRENREIVRSRNAKRKAKKRNATPDWLTPLDFLVMRHIYETCPEGHHVDHIVPLKGKTVSGLHVPWNLQHLPAAENISKGNREWPDMWLLEEAA